MKTRNFPAKKALRRIRALGHNIRLPFVDDQRYRLGRQSYEQAIHEELTEIKGKEKCPN